MVPVAPVEYVEEANDGKKVFDSEKEEEELEKLAD
jgi:hypothetical protein